MLGRGAFPLLLLACVSYPFSVATANAALGALLGVSILSGDYIAGLRQLWTRHRGWLVAGLVYLALLPLGLLWSPEPDWGRHLVLRQWFWFLIPAIMASVISPKQRHSVMLALSVGLSAHLLFCMGQMAGLIHFVKDGSSANDATGHIGHIGFGFVHGLWAAWLLRYGLQTHGWRRYLAWLLALWAVVMVFIAAGRSGYLVVAVLALVMAWRMAPWETGRKLALVAAVAAGIIAVVMLSPTARERILWTWQGYESLQQGDFQHANARWSLWYAALHVWLEHPALGVGTGGFRSHAAQLGQQRSDLFFGGPEPAHPHNMYLLALVRWGPAGLIALLVWLGVWIRTGWREDWHASDAGPLISLPAIALAVHGLSAPSLEEHFPGILAILMAGCGFAARRFSRTPSDASSSA